MPAQQSTLARTAAVLERPIELLERQPMKSLGAARGRPQGYETWSI